MESKALPNVLAISCFDPDSPVHRRAHSRELRLEAMLRQLTSLLTSALRAIRPATGALAGLRANLRRPCKVGCVRLWLWHGTHDQ